MLKEKEFLRTRGAVFRRKSAISSVGAIAWNARSEARNPASDAVLTESCRTYADALGNLRRFDLWSSKIRNRKALGIF